MTSEIVAHRLRCLKAKGFEVKDTSPDLWPIELYHRRNPARSYNPEHILCYMMLWPDGQLIKSRYCDNWKIEAGDTEGFRLFLESIPVPLFSRIGPMLRAAFHFARAHPAGTQKFSGTGR
ncbi:MAG: hypothetical protein J0H10_08025 [Alphaproteobacteria bacterium]|nr:hypothetical protein [Alphaproteobacteria bacterium]